jgi:hypothetical protein
MSGDKVIVGREGTTYRREVKHERHRDKRDDFEHVEQVHGLRSILGDISGTDLGGGVSQQLEGGRQQETPTDNCTLISAAIARGRTYVGSATVKSVSQPNPPTFNCSKGKSHNLLIPKNNPREIGI